MYGEKINITNREVKKIFYKLTISKRPVYHFKKNQNRKAKRQ